LNQTILFDSMKRMLEDDGKKEDDKKKEKKRKLYHNLPDSLKALLKSLNNLFKELIGENPSIQKMSYWIGYILNFLPDFYEDVNIKNNIKKYFHLFEYSIKRNINDAFVMAFCNSVFTDGLPSFFSGFDGFYGEDISLQMASNETIKKLNIILIKENIAFIENLRSIDKLSYYLIIKKLSEEFESLEQRQNDSKEWKKIYFNFFPVQESRNIPGFSTDLSIKNPETT